jgi:multisubunit Na+/H+ antiporter MnhF subunit
VELVTSICLAVLAVAAVLCLYRLARSTTITDRIVALDLLLVLIISGLAIAAVRTGSGVFLDLAVVGALLGFVGTSMVARFVEERGA